MSTNAPAPSPAPVPPTLIIQDAIKRKYDDLVSALSHTEAQAAPAGKRRKRSPTVSASLPPMERLVIAAKYFTRAVNPFMDIAEAMLYGPDHHWSARAVSCPSNTIVIPSSELERQQLCIRAFDKMFGTVPDLLEVVKHLFLEASSKPGRWKKLVKQMQAAAKSARTADTNGLKHQLSYVLPNPLKEALVPPVLKQESKSDRRFILPWSDHMLLPPLVLSPSPVSGTSTDETGATETAVTGAQTELLNRLVAGRVELTATAFPSFFWEEGSYNPDDLDHGLLRGHLILRIPGVCNARVHEVFKIDREMIGYAGVQARTMMSTSEWSPRDGSYSYEELFKSIVNLFADPDDPWAKETLDWFQRNIFGDAINDSNASRESVPDASANILAQRIARRKGLPLCSKLFIYALFTLRYQTEVTVDWKPSPTAYNALRLNPYELAINLHDHFPQAVLSSSHHRIPFSSV
ncbi:hypothetical protein B0H17DRAFT_1138894 [Mycena rosella]|uniref:Uncharacterized protein n=1 Tax=Mycena rosella TaxID=1033263 RepID=A0AAD7GBT0_MYCRO|nr:hypothetical protein B0H17DRAFT_1138894 [Mycena rosella]